MIGFIEQQLLSVYKKYRKVIIVFPVVIGCLFYLTTAFTPISDEKEQVNPIPYKESVLEVPELLPENSLKEAAPIAAKPSKSNSVAPKSKPMEASTDVIEKEEIIDKATDAATDIVVYTPTKEAIEKMTRPMRSASVKVLGKQIVSSKKPYLRLVLLEPFQFGTVRLPKGSDVFAKATFEEEGVRLRIDQIKVEQQLYDTNMVVLGPEGYAIFPTQGKTKLKFTNEAMTLRLEE